MGVHFQGLVQSELSGQAAVVKEERRQQNESIVKIMVGTREVNCNRDSKTRDKLVETGHS